MPDHSMLQCKLRITEYVTPQHDDERSTAYYPPGVKYRKYDVNKLPDEMFSVQDSILEAVHRIEQNVKNQNEMNMHYEKLLELIHGEMDTHLKYSNIEVTFEPVTVRSKSRAKPWWNQTLKELLVGRLSSNYRVNHAHLAESAKISI